jgi:hypothetical protein
MGGVEVEFHHLSTRWRRVVSHFNPGEIAPGTHWLGGWVGVRAGLDAVEKNLSPVRNPTLAVQPIAPRYTDVLSRLPICIGLYIIFFNLIRNKACRPGSKGMLIIKQIILYSMSYVISNLRLLPNLLSFCGRFVLYVILKVKGAHTSGAATSNTNG